MIKIVTIILLFTTSVLSCYAQTEVKNRVLIGSVNIEEKLYASLSVLVSPSGDSIYILSYQNQADPKLNSFENIELGSLKSKNGFYSMVKGFFSPEQNKYEGGAKINIGTTKISLSYKAGRKKVVTISTDKGYTTLNEKQLDQLFDKVKQK